MTPVPPDYVADPYHRLGVAKELLRCVLDPHDLGSKISGPEHLRDRIRAFLTAEGAQGMGPAETAARTAVAAQAIPWPRIATRGLYPGDRVTHETLGAGVLVPFDADVWPTVVELVADGRVLVEFDDDPPSLHEWVAVELLTAVDPPAEDWQRQAARDEAVFLRNVEHAEVPR